MSQTREQPSPKAVAGAGESCRMLIDRQAASPSPYILTDLDGGECRADPCRLVRQVKQFDR